MVAGLSIIGSSPLFIVAAMMLQQTPAKEPAAEDEPVVSDEEFEAALPEIDDDAAETPVSADLPEANDETGEDEAELSPSASAPSQRSEEQSDSEMLLPEATDDETTEAIPDVEVDAEALAVPLAPLDSFDITELAAPEGDPDAPPEAIRYYLVVEGLDAIGLDDKFRDFSSLDEGDGEASNAAMLRARAETDSELAVRIMRSRGYYDAVAASEVVLPPEPDGRYRVEIIATPGAQYTFSEVSVVGEEASVPAKLVSSNLELKPGDPVVTENVLSAEATMDLVFPYNGYPFAEVEQRGILLDEANKTADYVLPVDLGPRSRFRNVISEGDETFDAEHLAVLKRFEAGDLYDVRKQDDLRESMIATGLFNSVAIEPVYTNEFNEDGTMAVDLGVTQEAGPPRSITGTAGYSTGLGARLEARWIHRNLFPPEGAFEVSGVAGTREQGAGVLFRRSNAGQRDRTVLLSLNAGRTDFAAYEAYTVALRGRISRESTPIWQKKWTYAFGAELIGTSETQFGKLDILGPDDTYYIAALPGQLGYDASNSLLDPTSGWRATVRLSPELALQGADVQPYLVSQIDTSGYYPITDALTIAGRIRLGGINGIGRNDLAPSRRFYAGGGGSVRGYGFQDIGPTQVVVTPPTPEELAEDPDAEPTTDYYRLGGRALNEFSVEGRYRFGNFGVAAFVDGGQVYEEQYPRFNDLQFGAGIGGRYYTNFGPFRADVAIPLNKRPGQANWGVYISIGQAF